MSNNLNPNIWGPSVWDGMKYIAYGYPNYPTKKDIKHYWKYFKYLGYVLPCGQCQNTYIYHISNGSCKLTLDVFANQTSLTKWLYNIHNLINEELGKTCKLTYEEFMEDIEFDKIKSCGLN